jgi:hypothetical protein
MAAKAKKSNPRPANKKAVVAPGKGFQPTKLKLLRPVPSDI